MKSVFKIAVRNIQKNFKRTILTIIGIIVASALISGVCTIFTSITRTMQNTIISERGKYHFIFNDIDIEQRKHIYDKFLPDISYEEEEAVKLPKSDEEVKEKGENGYVKYNTDGYKNLNIRLRSGEYPKKPDEILISTGYAKTNKLKIGSTVNKFGKHKVVGIYNDIRFNAGMDRSYFLGFINSKPEGKFNYYIYFNKINEDLVDSIEKYAQDNKIDFTKNNLLLNFSKVSFKSETYRSLAIFFAILFMIIAVASISLTYNAFSISLNNRRREFAIVGCVGAKKSQLKGMVYCEVLILGIIGTTLGVACGIVGVYITLDVVNRIIATLAKDITMSFVFDINIWTIVTAYVLSLITLFIAAIFPARRAKKISLIEAVRGQDAVSFNKKTGKKLKKSYSFSKFLMGYEGLLAKKNIVRSKKQYRIIIASLVVSGIIFLASSSFMDIMIKSVETKLQRVDNIMNRFIVYADGTEENFDSFIDKNGKYLEEAKIYLVNSATLPDGNTVEIRSYKEGTIGEIESNNTLSVNYDIKGVKEGNNLTLKKGDKDINIKINKLIKNDLKEDGKYLVISNDEFKKLFGEDRTFVMLSAKAKEDKANYVADEVDNYATDNRYTCINAIKELSVFRSIKIIVNIFVYGFVGLVSLVSIVNMVNTISSGIQVRTRELAVLRSVGMSKRNMLMMLIFENLFIVTKTLIILMPIGLIVHYLLIKTMEDAYKIDFFINFTPVLVVVAALMVFTMIPTLYSVLRLRKSQIIESLR